MAAELTPWPWQIEPWRRLHAQRQRGQMPHAILLIGQPGLGLNHFASVLAQSLLCDQPRDDGQPCGDCGPCRQFAGDVHPDFQRLTLLEDKKHILVDQIREINEFIGLTSGGSGRKAVVISPADRMNVNAANSLLKTLEEPPGDITIILVARQLHLLPATIKSRCQMLKFSPPSREEASAWLSQRGHADPEALLQLGQGAPCLAERMDAPSLFQAYDAVASDIIDLLQGRKTFPQLRGDWRGRDIHRLMDWSLSLLRDCIRAASYPADGRFENPGRIADLREIANRLHLSRLFTVHDHLVALMNRLEHPLNQELLLDDLLLSWQSLGR